MLITKRPEYKKLMKKVYDKKRREDNIKAEKQKARKYYLKNKSEILIRQKEYDLEHKQKRKDYNASYYKNKKEVKL